MPLLFAYGMNRFSHDVAYIFIKDSRVLGPCLP